MTYDKHGILVILPVNFIGKIYEEFSKVRGDSIHYKGFNYEYDHAPSNNQRLLRNRINTSYLIFKDFGGKCIKQYYNSNGYLGEF